MRRRVRKLRRHRLIRLLRHGRMSRAAALRSAALCDFVWTSFARSATAAISRRSLTFALAVTANAERRSSLSRWCSHSVMGVVTPSRRGTGRNSPPCGRRR